MKEFGVGFMGGLVFQCYSARTLPQLRAELSRLGFALHELDGSSVRDEASLFAAVRRAMPSSGWGPSPNRVWDAFLDSFTDAVLEQPADRVAILWLVAEKMLDGRL